MMNNVTTIKSESNYKNKLGQNIKVIKENGKTVFRSVNGEVIRDLTKPEVNTPEQEMAISEMYELEVTNNDIKVKSIIKRFLKNPVIKLLITLSIITAVIIFLKLSVTMLVSQPAMPLIKLGSCKMLLDFIILTKNKVQV